MNGDEINGIDAKALQAAIERAEERGVNTALVKKAKEVLRTTCTTFAKYEFVDCLTGGKEQEACGSVAKFQFLKCYTLKSE